jgi:RNA polymerase sigma-70 factor (ECF subfamily)
VKGVRDLPDEQLLLETFSNGDFTYIDFLICRYEDSLFNLCLKLTKNRHDAEELYQQTWLKAIQKSHTCTKSIKNWLYTVCLNAYRDSYRRSRRESEVIENTLDDAAKDYIIAAATDNMSAENEALKKLTGEMLINKVSKLPDKRADKAKNATARKGRSAQETAAKEAGQAQLGAGIGDGGFRRVYDTVFAASGCRRGQLLYSRYQSEHQHAGKRI